MLYPYYTDPDIEKATVVYPLREGSIFLAQKKQNIHTKKGEELTKSAVLNGWGGKQELTDSSIYATAVRELWEESTIQAKEEDLVPVGRLYFFWPGNTSGIPNMIVTFFFLYIWEGELKETEWMGEPLMFSYDAIPYDRLFKADRKFLPKFLAGEKFVADVFFDQKDENGLPVMILKDEAL